MNPRILIFIVAYNAETTIRSVLSRIPESLLNYDVEVLIIDDASKDLTFEEAHKYGEETSFPFKLTVLTNPVNQGYGGNQKIGFHYALTHNFDIVALVHGDGQYAPEALPELLAPILNDEADVVFGSRMMVKGDALKGGMPLYKYIGNKILTTIQNKFLNASLSEFHSGYRIYAIPALKAIPFDLNSPDYHFDTEIIIQLMFAKMRIKELPIPTYYGDEICYVNGMKYAVDVLLNTFLAWLQHYDILYQRKFDVTPPKTLKIRYWAKLDFMSSHTMALESVPSNSKLLDLGCAGGYMVRAFQEKGCQVTGVDRFPPSEESNLDHFIQADLDTDSLPIAMETYDHLLLLDVIEHLRDPESFILKLSEASAKNPNLTLTLTTGNIGFFVVRLMLLFGGFNYGQRGILDLDHKRLFTFKSMRRLLEQHGFKVVETRGIPAPFPLVVGTNALGRFLIRVNQGLIFVSKGLFSYQIFMRAKPIPKLESYLQSAISASQNRRLKSDS